jgi:protein-disulfide isomerase
MSDKKIIVSALILSALLISGAWYYSKHGLQTAAILPAASSVPEVSAITAGGIVVGNPAAPVMMEEYTNFMCSHCQNFAGTTLKRIENEYVKTGKVKLVIYIFPPLEFGKAAFCAQEQDKFLEMHDYLFTHQITQEEDFVDFAINAGLDGKIFGECFNSDKYNETAQKWYDEGLARGITGTPTFYINGRQIVGALPFEEFQKIIEEKLTAATK